MATTKYWQKEIETMKRSELEALQLERLKYIVKYCYERVPFYQKRFDSIGLKPEDIQNFKDIEKIPFTTKDDIRDNYPFGLFLRFLRSKLSECMLQAEQPENRPL